MTGDARGSERTPRVEDESSPRRVGGASYASPPFSGLYVDAQGRLWVRLHARGYEEPETPGEQERRERACAFFAATEAECNANIEWWREPVVYEVIEPDGRFLGRVELPNRRTELVHARDRLLWVVELGELGEGYVVRYRIGPPG